MESEKELLALQIYSLTNYAYDYLEKLSLEELKKIYEHEMSKDNGKDAKK